MLGEKRSSSVSEDVSVLTLREGPTVVKIECPWENRMGGFRKGGFSNNRFVLKPDVAIASEVSILSKNSLAITDFHAKKTQHVQLFENPLPGTPPPFAIPGKDIFGCFLCGAKNHEW